MKKTLFPLCIALVAMLASCADYSDDLKGDNNPVEKSYTFFANSLATVENDTIYGGLSNEMLFFLTDIEKDSIVAVQIDFGDGSIDGGTQVLHKYKAAGVYSMKITNTKTGGKIERIVKIIAPSVSTKETIIQLSGNTIGDSASINLLCKKDKIYNWQKNGQYFLKGDMNDWKTAITAVDTNYIYDGERYLLFNFKVKNGQWYSFGYYKSTYSTGEQWSYDPLNQYWDVTKGLYKFFVSNARIYKNELTAQIPGSCGDMSISALGPVIRLEYETNSYGADSLVIYANRNYLINSDSTKLGIGYSVNGEEFVKKSASFNKAADYIYVKLPVDKNSTVRFKTYSDIANNITGDMTGSRFYSDINDCYLKIAGSVPTSRSIAENGNIKGIKIILLNGDIIYTE